MLNVGKGQQSFTVRMTAEVRKDTDEADKTAKARRVWKEENLTGRAYEYFHKLQQ